MNDYEREVSSDSNSSGDSEDTESQDGSIISDSDKKSEYSDEE